MLSKTVHVPSCTTDLYQALHQKDPSSQHVSPVRTQPMQTLDRCPRYDDHIPPPSRSRRPTITNINSYACTRRHSKSSHLSAAGISSCTKQKLLVYYTWHVTMVLASERWCKDGNALSIRRSLVVDKGCFSNSLFWFSNFTQFSYATALSRTRTNGHFSLVFA